MDGEISIQIITVDDLIHLIRQQGLQTFFLEFIERLKKDFSRWLDFHKTVRHATHYPFGVIELMPISDDRYYSFKYVNGHPHNPRQNKLSVIAVGMLADVASGYPLLICDMTLLTAIRTAATSALASRYLAVANPRSMALIGTGAQAEFQTLAHHFALGITEVRYYDPDATAMNKFARNLEAYPLELIPACDVKSAVEKADIVTMATAAKTRAKVLKNDWVTPGMHINAIGGDCPGKTELDPQILHRSKPVVEFYPQTRLEGEIQACPDLPIYAELWEIIRGIKPGRQNSTDIFIYDSVGFALEDYSILRYVYDLLVKKGHEQAHAFIPELTDPKNLFGLLN